MPEAGGPGSVDSSFIGGEGVVGVASCGGVGGIQGDGNGKEAIIGGFFLRRGPIVVVRGAGVGG